MSTGKLTTAEDRAEQPVFAAVIKPHRSLGPEGFRVLMVVLSVVAAALALRFVALGFWPVTGFLGLDVLALYVAFRISYRRARAFEEVSLTPVEILFRSVTHRGQAREWRFNPLWTRLVRETHEEFGLQRLALVSGRQRIVIGRELSPAERADFADAFGAALSRVKRGM
ncbi:DUF2244 domain-containing protein [Enterovirga sp.]|jgi:uncharacterized membrane protein|uniref:DUF2244 domain-containing protein n=1 Tax=Enterovirga sp. TaxID=2026350 RepID=UPI00262E18CC|nr:DUF2244 domain-containing protein [Enterovirga sp.]MDB5591305.1 hypothetical protein [Enterovirga sp.]